MNVVQTLRANTSVRKDYDECHTFNLANPCGFLSAKEAMWIGQFFQMQFCALLNGIF